MDEHSSKITNFPKQGTLIWLDFDPTAGVEINKRRPALVFTNNGFQARCNLVGVIPITSTDNGFPLHIPLRNCRTTGVLACEHFKSLDYKARNWQFIEKIPDEIFEEVQEMMAAMQA